MSPSFTIAIPVYERLFGFEEALDSALAVKGCTEILIADNHSSHNEFEKICSVKNDDRIRYVKHERNYGIYGNENKCAELANGDFLAILGSDDIIAADVYERFLQAFQSSSNLDVFFGPFTIFQESIADAFAERHYSTGPLSNRKFLEDAVDFGMRFPVLFVVRRKKLLLHPFVTEPHSSNDLLWIYSNASNLVLYADYNPLSYWRKHPGQDSTVSINEMYDVFPFIYENISHQLANLKSKKAKQAYRRAERVILSFLVNEKKRDCIWRKRLLGPECNRNPFLIKIREIADRNWLIRQLLYADKSWSLYYNLSRVYRKTLPFKGI